MAFDLLMPFRLWNVSPMGQPITLAGKAGEKLSKVGYVNLGDITISSNPYHTKGDSHPQSSTGVPVFSVMRELATFTVSERLRKSKSRVVTEIRAILGDFPDSRILRVRVNESRIVQVAPVARKPRKVA